MRCLCRTGRACFFLSAFLLPVCSPSCVEGLAFSHPVSPLSRICSQLAHTGPTAPLTHLAGVVSLPRPLTGLKSPHRAEFGFSSQNESTPPPKGGGAGFCSSLGGRVLLGSCLWQLLATTGSRWLNRAGVGLRWCCFSTPPSNRPRIAAQGRVWFSPPFPGALLLRQPRKLAFQVVVDRLLDGADSELQGAIPHLA